MILDNNNQYTFILIAGQIGDLNSNDFEKLSNLHKLHRENSVKLYIFSSSDSGRVKELLTKNGWSDVNMYSVDQIVLKSMIRDTKGVLMLNNGIISGKWNLKHNSLNNINSKDLEKLVNKEKFMVVKFIIIITFTFAIFCYLMNLYRNQRRKESERGSN